LTFAGHGREAAEICEEAWVRADLSAVAIGRPDGDVTRDVCRRQVPGSGAKVEYVGSSTVEVSSAGGAVTGFSMVESNAPASLRDLPPLGIPHDQRLTEDVQARRARQHAFRPIGPFRAAANQNRHGAFEFIDRQAPWGWPANTFKTVT